MVKNNKELIARQREINALLANCKEEERESLVKEYEANKREIETNNQEAVAKANQPKVEMSKNEQMREAIAAIRKRQLDGDFQLRADSQKTITSGVIATNDVNNMASAGIPLTIKDLVNPLEMGLVYDKLGINIATGVKGNIQWPVLDTAAEVSVGGELDAASDETLDFSKITATPVKLGISIAVSNEAINDESFDLVGCITSQMNKAVGRVLNKRVLALATPSAKAGFVGPLEAIQTAITAGSGGTAAQKAIVAAQSKTFAAQGAPTYKEIKALKGLVLKTGAQMEGFCYVMDAAMYSLLEATSKDTGSGTFIIENGKIDGAPVFLTNISDYAGKVVAGCFAYVALNQHGETHFIVDPYTQAKKNVTVFTLNGDWSITTIKSAPFAIGK